MAHKFPSADWTAAYKDAVNGNAAYRVAGKEWLHGAVAFVVEADAALGLEKDSALILDVHGGECRGTRWVERAVAEADAPFVIVGKYARWKDVITGKEDPIKSMMQNKLRLVKGHLPTIIRYVESSRQLVKSAANVDSLWVA
jgi:putative sterol carrier protein